jgi:uncharacterized protein
MVAIIWAVDPLTVITTQGSTLMDMTSTEFVAAPRQVVWAALNDPAILKLCIPGCESLERDGEDTLSATASLRIGPVKARFKGLVTLSEIDPPNGYLISGSGQGGVAGFAKGSARVRLEEVSGGTNVIYTAHADVGGKLAQLGSRLIDSTANSIAKEFFANFAREVGLPMPAATADEAVMPPAARTLSERFSLFANGIWQRVRQILGFARS